MEKLKSIRGGHRSVVTPLIRRTDEKIATEISPREIRTAIDSLETKRYVLLNLDSQIIDVTEIDDMEQEMLDTDDFNYTLESTICKYKELLEEETKPQRTLSENAQSTSHTSSIPFLNQNSNQTSQEIHTTTFVPNHSESQPMTVSNHTESQSMAQPMTTFMSNFYHRLPKLGLPTFSGDILAWQIFWDSFQTTVHNNPSLTNVKKFSYLKT